MPRPSKIGPIFDEACMWIKKHYPSKRGYVIRTVSHIKGNDRCDYEGDTREMEDGRIIIRVRIVGLEKSSIDTLLHEVAHALDIDANGWPKDYKDHSSCHRESWGVFFSELYREYYKYMAERYELETSPKKKTRDVNGPSQKSW